MQELVMISAVGGLAILGLIAAIAFVILSRQGVSRTPAKNGATNKRAEVVAEKKESEKEKPALAKDAPAAGQLEGGWLDAFRSASPLGDISVKVVSVEVGSPKMVNGESFGEPLLLVRLELSNSSRQNVTYVSWNMAAEWTSIAWLTDVAGNKYQLRRFRPAMVGQLARVMNIAPGTSIEDLLIFPRPAMGNGAGLKLQLPAAVVQARGSANFQIPAKMVTLAASTGEVEGNRPSLISAGFRLKGPASAGKKPADDEDAETTSEALPTKKMKKTDDAEMDQGRESPPADAAERKPAKALKSRSGGEQSQPTNDPMKDFGIDPDGKAPF